LGWSEPSESISQHFYTNETVKGPEDVNDPTASKINESNPVYTLEEETLLGPRT